MSREPDAADLWLAQHDAVEQPARTVEVRPRPEEDDAAEGSLTQSALIQLMSSRDSDIQPLSWKRRAACAGVTDKMFPQGHKDITYLKEARAICAGCRVREECLEYALTFPTGDMHGVWAGMTTRQLSAEQKRRKIRPTRPTLAEMWAELH